MALIGFIRHGITDWNVQGKALGLSDQPLNEEGRQQAEALAGRLLKEPWDMIISSNLSRAQETAGIIAAAAGIPVCLTDDRLREIDCGQIEGMTEEERIDKWGLRWRDLNLGMESVHDTAARGASFLEEIHSSYIAKNILAVSHGALIGLTLQHLLPLQFTATHMRNTSLTLLTKANGRWQCDLYNCVNHLSTMH
ncbi:histidine phosphatase family protein [Paenibacillus sp. IHBB 3054]|uniref:histidine phosphatase family protein n=1 Tax=Paenibacillus sp. IHBB 3054 TaxID=3425689 RepID=UPI003F67FCF8